MATYGINIATGEKFITIVTGSEIAEYALKNHRHNEYVTVDEFNTIVSELQNSIIELQNSTSVELAPTINSINIYYLENKQVGITAIINPNNLPTTTKISYSDNINLESPIELDGNNLSGSTTEVVSFIIPRLNPNTYYFRINASNSINPTNSELHSFSIYTGTGRQLTDYTEILNNLRLTFTGTTYYIDPTASINGNGLSEETPFNSWSSVLNMGSNRNYLQKSGTTATFTTAFNGINGAIRIGTYGGNERAKIVKTSSVSYFLESRYTIMLENIEIEGNYTADNNGVAQFTGVGIRLRNSPNSIIYNCSVHGFNQPITFNPVNGTNGASWAGVKVLYTDIYDAALDGIYADDVTEIEIAHCNIYDINQLYFSSTNDTISAGDGIQFAFSEVSAGDYLRFNVHHNTIDRTSTGNKFCFIWGAGTVQRRAEGSIYNNEFRINGNNENCLYSDITNIGEVDIYNNYFYSTSGTGQAFHCRTLSLAKYHHNLIENFGYGLANEGAARVDMYNNTLIDCLYAYGVDSTTGLMKFNYNIVKSDNTASRLIYGSNFSSIIEQDYNCYNLDTILTSYPTLTNLRTLLSFDANSIDLDADLKIDYTLNSTSPCILTGTDIGAFNYS